MANPFSRGTIIDMIQGWVVRRMIIHVFAAIGSRDLAAATGRLHSDVHHRFAGTHALGGERHDKAAVHTWFERLFRLYPALTFDLGAISVTGWPWAMHVTVEWVATATPAYGDPYTNVGAHVLRIERGQVTHLHAYEDSQAVAIALERMAAHGIAEASAPPIVS